jgi:methyl-accepting chemotaxis protein
MENLLTISIAVTSAAVVLQACILVAMYLAMRRSSAHFEALAEEMKGKVLPTVENANTMLADIRPKLDTILTNVSDSSTVVREQIQRIDATLSDLVDRSRLQIIRADEMLTRTLNKVEEATDTVQKTVVSPVRQLSGLAHGLGVGIEAFLGKRRKRQPVSVPQDEMFI